MGMGNRYHYCSECGKPVIFFGRSTGDLICDSCEEDATKRAPLRPDTADSDVNALWEDQGHE